MPFKLKDFEKIVLLHSELDGVFSEAYEHYSYYTGHDFFVFGQKIGLTDNAAKSLMTKLCTSVERTYKYIIDASQCPADMKTVIKSHIADRLERLTRPYPQQI